MGMAGTRRFTTYQRCAAYSRRACPAVSRRYTGPNQPFWSGPARQPAASPASRNSLNMRLKHGPPADEHACDQPAPAEHVDHGELLGDPRGWVVQRQGVADHCDPDARRLAGEDRRDQVRQGHVAVGVLMVLVDADAVEANLFG